MFSNSNSVLYVSVVVVAWLCMTAGAVMYAVRYVRCKAKQGNDTGDFPLETVASGEFAKQSDWGKQGLASSVFSPISEFVLIAFPDAVARVSLSAVTVVAFVISLAVATVSAMCMSSWVECLEVGVCYAAVTAAALIDSKLHIIPNAISLVIVVVRLAVLVVCFVVADDAPMQLVNSALACLLCFVALSLAGRLARGGIGAGDIKLLCSIGFMCGFYAIMYTMLYSMIACICVTLFLIWKKRRTTKDKTPFAPFAYIGYTAMLMLAPVVAI